MSLRFFEGPAGSGKTTHLFEALAAILETRALGDHQRVLALTKMHGSRRRMHGRLARLSGLRGRFECATIDSFAWRVLRRWNSLARARGNAGEVEHAYDAVCRRAGALLSEADVGRWATRSFPVIVIDEMQDSKNGQLAIVRALSESAACLAAADGYQDLDASSENVAVAWALGSGEIVSLTHNHRTSAAGLLAAAGALRHGRGVPLKGPGFSVLGAPNMNVGASFVANNLTWWMSCNDIVVLSPVHADKGSFVGGLIHRVEEKPIGNPPRGPYMIPWEVSQEDESERFLSGLALPVDTSAEVSASEICLPSDCGPARALRVWLDQQRRVAGRTTFKGTEISQQVHWIHQRSRAYRRVRDRGIRAMTIHQAKNREFDSVIALWPYNVAGSADRKRRLLYNAITRAKRQAVVIVQNPDRLKQPPFVPDGD